MSDNLTESSAYQKTPKLSHAWLTALLLGMCVVPLATIAALFTLLPPVHEGTLEAAVSAEGLPSAQFYEQHFSTRPVVTTGELIVRNQSDQDWTHLNIQVNGNYQIYERVPIPAGQERRFKLDRFVSRTGATFDLRYNPLRRVKIYARRPTKDRATFSCNYPWDKVE